MSNEIDILMQRAQRFRRLATTITDARAVDALHEIAAELDLRVETLSKGQRAPTATSGEEEKDFCPDSAVDRP